MTSLAEAYRAEGLLPYHELPDITQPGWCPDPLVIAREPTDNQHLLALGLAHRTDIGNEHYQVLTDRSIRFLGATALVPRVALNEGGDLWQATRDLEVAYKQGGEPRWLRTFARLHHMPVFSPELEKEGAPILLAKGFTPAEIACFYFVRQAPQWSRLTVHWSRPYFEEYMAGHMRNLERITGTLPGLKQFSFSYDNLVRTYEDIFGKEFNRKDIQFFYQQSVGYMLKPTSRIQEIAIACNMARDINFVRTIQEYVNDGVSVEWVCGWTHVRALQERLKHMKPRVGRIALSA
jgi:hypothetical protein